MPSRQPAAKHSDSLSVRLDKWLWAARFYKTRALAREMIQSGKVQYNGQRSKPSKLVELGAMITLPRGHDLWQVEIRQLSDQRRNAAIAETLYAETAASAERRVNNAEARKLNLLYNPHPQGKPDKKQRRQLIRTKQQ